MKFSELKGYVKKLLKISDFSVKDGKHFFTDEQTAALEGIEPGYAAKLTEALDRELEAQGQNADVVAELRGNMSVLETSNAVLQSTIEEQSRQIETMANQPEPDLATGAPNIKTDKQKHRVDMGKPINVVAQKAFEGNRDAIMIFMGKVEAGSIDISEIIEDANFDTFYNQEKREIARTLSFGFESQPFFTPVRAVEMYRATKSSFTEVVQPFVSKWTPKGKAKFTPITIMNRRCKINVTFEPADIEGYLFYLYDEGVEPAQMPIAKYLYEYHIRPQVFNDIEIQILGNGKYAEPPADMKENDPGRPAVECADGIPEIMRKLYAKNNNRVNWVDDSGLWTIDNAEDKANLYKKKLLDTPYHLLPMDLAVSPQNLDAYVECIKKRHRVGIKDDNVPLKLSGSNITLVSKPFLIGHDEIKFLTPKKNRVLLRHKNNPDKLRMFDDKKYAVNVIGEFWLAPGFGIEEEIWAGVPGDLSASGSGM